MRLVLTLVILLTFCGTALAGPGFPGRPITSNAFGRTGYTLHRDEFTIGLGPIYFGISENFHAGTNLLLWAFQVYNADVKAALKKDDDGAVAIGLQAYRLSLDVGDSDGEFDFLALAPYAAISQRITPKTMVHLGGQYAYFEAEEDTDIDDAEASESATGTNIYMGIEHSRSNRTKFVADVGYDTTFEGMRLSGAFLFGWERFRIKLGLSYFTAGDGFTFPLIGMWWRFKA